MTKLQAAELTGRHLDRTARFETTVGNHGPVPWTDSERGVPVAVEGILREIHHTPADVHLNVTWDGANGDKVEFTISPDAVVTIVEGRIA